MNSRESQYRSTPENTPEEHKLSEVKFRTIIDTIPVIAWYALSDGSGEFWNRRWHDYTGLSLETARGWGWRAAIHPEDLEKLERRWRADLASGQAGSVEGRLRRFDGEYRWFLLRASPLRDASGKILRWYGTNTDIDDRKRAEEELQRSEAFLAEGQKERRRRERTGKSGHAHMADHANRM